MNRRSVIAGLGALSTGTVAAIGSGAFSSAEAERSVSVELADDAAAYLALESDSTYAELNQEGLLELDFGKAVSGGGEHVGENSSYFFGSGNPERNVFTVQNQGTQTVEVTPAYQVLRFDSDGDPVENDGELVIALGNGVGRDPAELSPGDSTGYFVQIVTGDNPPASVDATFEINANEIQDE